MHWPHEFGFARPPPHHFRRGQSFQRLFDFVFKIGFKACARGDLAASEDFSFWSVCLYQFINRHAVLFREADKSLRRFAVGA